VLSTFAVILLVYASRSTWSSEKPNFLPTSTISVGVFREALPFPPQTATPAPCPREAADSLRQFGYIIFQQGIPCPSCFFTLLHKTRR
jgi:hypothetical protein